MKPDKLFHISEESGIRKFIPRPSPSSFEKISAAVVFAISERLLHNYLFPRDCPRVTYYAGAATSLADRKKFLGQSTADYVIAVEGRWLTAIQQTTLYCYRFSPVDFILLDECAEYYISYNEVEPLSVICIENPMEALLKKDDVELRFLPSLRSLADEVSKSSLNFSIIRMRNAVKNK